MRSPRWPRRPTAELLSEKLSFTTVSPIRNNYREASRRTARRNHIEWRQFHNESPGQGTSVQRLDFVMPFKNLGYIKIFMGYGSAATAMATRRSNKRGKEIRVPILLVLYIELKCIGDFFT